MGEETAVQAIVGSIVWVFRRLKKPRCREMSARGCALHSVCPQLSFPFPTVLSFAKTTTIYTIMWSLCEMMGNDFLSGITESPTAGVCQQTRHPDSHVRERDFAATQLDVYQGPQLAYTGLLRTHGRGVSRARTILGRQQTPQN